FLCLQQHGGRVLSPGECESDGGVHACELVAQTPSGQRCSPEPSLRAYLLRILHVEFSRGDPLFLENLHHGPVEPRAIVAIRIPHELDEREGALDGLFPRPAHLPYRETVWGQLTPVVSGDSGRDVERAEKGLRQAPVEEVRLIGVDEEPSDREWKRPEG